MNSKPILHFDGVNSFFSLPNFLASHVALGHGLADASLKGLQLVPELEVHRPVKTGFRLPVNPAWNSRKSAAVISSVWVQASISIADP